MPKHIGIVGCSAEGAALCYRTICSDAAAWMGPHAHPELSMHTHSLADYVACLSRNDMQGVAALMVSSANKLAGMGAELLICPDNTIHQAFAEVSARSAVPWLHIAECVAHAASERGYRRVGIMGTRWLVQSQVYPEALAAHGVEAVCPNAHDVAEVDRIILQELVCGGIDPRSTMALLQVVQRLSESGCDAVALACTELPLVLGDHNSTLPTLDSTRLLARAALRAAIG